jgi:UDP-N-acetylglucosamine--N-acetylmuramyl-(pentapeptide) pyrophosphoryl-undecaprenol N-acetylglucosamine transferase
VSERRRARILIAGGGTGGHAIPALCVAESLRERDAAVEFVGSSSGIEAELVPQAGYPFHPLSLQGMAGGVLARGRAAALFARAALSCRRLMCTLHPDAVLGVGGYASAPAVAAARFLGIPTFLHEQNSVPGRVNRLASRFTTGTLVTFPAAAARLRNGRRVGMPTRREFFEADREEALRELGLEPPVVLVFGGSGGALRINLAAAEAFSGKTAYTVVQVAGRRDFKRLSTSNPRHLILEYEPELWRYVAACELAVTRAGAGSLFDLAAAGRAAILIPYPYATGNHQLHNARYFVVRGAAELLPDDEVDAGTLRRRVEGLLEDGGLREKLAGRMKELATPDAASEVAQTLLEAAGKGRNGR